MSRQLNALTSPKSLSITFHVLSANCPEGYDTVAQNLDGSGKKWAQPHPDGHRSLQQCADICNDRIGCTSFEYANGPKEHGACGTYTGDATVKSNIKGNENRDRASSNWFSCVKQGHCPDGYYASKSNLDGSGKEWAQPHPDNNRRLQQCADICNARSGCTSFEYSNGSRNHGGCGTYTGGSSNLKMNEKRDRASSAWFSCLKI